jgi:hypothetical protein
MFQNMFSLCCHTSLTFYGSSTENKRMLQNSLSGYGGSLFSPEQIVNLVRVRSYI